MLRNSSCIVVKIRWTPAWRTTEPYANWSTPRGLSIIWSNKSWSLLCAAAFLLQWKYIQNWTKDVPENTSKEHEYGAYSLNSLTSRVFPISLIYIPKDMIQIFSFQRKGKIDVSMWTSWHYVKLIRNIPLLPPETWSWAEVCMESFPVRRNFRSWTKDSKCLIYTLLYRPNKFISINHLILY